MKTTLILIPVVLGVGLFLSTKLGSAGVLSSVQERIAYHAKVNDVPVSLIKAFAKVESNFNPKARNFEKSAGAFDDSIGLMQITPALAFDYGLITQYKNPTQIEISKMFNINNNLNVACRHLKYLHKYPFSQMVQSYNVGEQGYLNGVRNRDYLYKVRDYYESYN